MKILILIDRLKLIYSTINTDTAIEIIIKKRINSFACELWKFAMNLVLRTYCRAVRVAGSF